MAWVLANPQISSIICGFLEDSHLDQALAAVELELSPSKCARLDLEVCYVPQAPCGTAAVLAS